jgi:hypothetical protein
VADRHDRRPWAVRLRYLSFRHLIACLACWPVFVVEESARPSDKGSANRQQEYATTCEVPDRDHLMAVWSPTDPGIATDLLRHNYQEISTLFQRYYEDQQTQSPQIKHPPHHHAVMTGRSSLLAAVMPIPQ